MTTSVSQLSLHVLVELLADGVEIECDDTDCKEDGRHQTGHETDAADGALTLDET